MTSINGNYEQIAKEFVTAIKKLVGNEHNIDNLECYLGYHFAEWLKKFANTPESMTAEIKSFAEMEI